MRNMAEGGGEKTQKILVKLMIGAADNEMLIFLEKFHQLTLSARDLGYTRTYLPTYILCDIWISWYG